MGGCIREESAGKFKKLFNFDFSRCKEFVRKWNYFFCFVKHGELIRLYRKTSLPVLVAVFVVAQNKVSSLHRSVVSQSCGHDVGQRTYASPFNTSYHGSGNSQMQIVFLL